jgi:hypothetical protein
MRSAVERISTDVLANAVQFQQKKSAANFGSIAAE